MGIYLFLAAISILFSWFTHAKLKTPKKVYLVTVFAVFGVVMALRGTTVGSDTTMGKYIFNQEVSRSWSQIDLTYPGWSILCKLIGLFGGDYIILQILASSIIIYGIARFIYVFSSNVILSSYLFIASYTFCSALNVMRQMCAVSLVLLAIVNLYEHKKVPCILLMIVACTIHTTAIAGLPICWVFKKTTATNYKKILGGLLIVALLLFLFYDKLIALITTIAPHYSSYLDMDASIGGRTVYVQLFYLVFVVLGYIYGTRESAEYKEIMIIALISVCIGIMGAKNAFFLRINYYYTIFMLCAVPNAIKKAVRDQKSELFANVGTVLIFLIPYIIQLNANYSNVIPYRMCF